MKTIKPIKVKPKNVYIMKMKVDTNDGDYKNHKIEIEKNDIKYIKQMCKAFDKMDEKHEDGYRHNYPTGEMYGYSMERITTKSKSKLNVDKETLDKFKRYVEKYFIQFIK